MKQADWQSHWPPEWPRKGIDAVIHYLLDDSLHPNDPWPETEYQRRIREKGEAFDREMKRKWDEIHRRLDEIKENEKAAHQRLQLRRRRARLYRRRHGGLRRQP